MAGDAITSTRDHESAGAPALSRRWSAMSVDERRRHGEDAFRYGVANYSLAANVDRLEEVLVGAARPA